MSKKKPGSSPLVYSTDPNFRIEEDDHSQETAVPALQPLRVRLDSKQRAGKAVTLVEGFLGTADDLDGLGKKLKTFCGTGGSVKDGLIIVQGDQKEKVLNWLLRNGYKQTKMR